MTLVVQHRRAMRPLGRAMMRAILLSSRDTTRLSIQQQRSARCTLCWLISPRDWTDWTGLDWTGRIIIFFIVVHLPSRSEFLFFFFLALAPSLAIYIDSQPGAPLLLFFLLSFLLSSSFLLPSLISLLPSHTLHTSCLPLSRSSTCPLRTTATARSP